MPLVPSSTDGRRRHNAAEYYAVGHDDAESLLDKELLESLHATKPPKETLSFMFCGSGDARHFLYTMYALAPLTQFNTMGGAKLYNNLHITLLDVNAAAIARTLIVLDMLYRYLMLMVQKVPNIEDVHIVISYLYSCPIVPPFVDEKLQELIDHIIGVLNGSTKVAAFLEHVYIAPTQRPKIIHVLEQWKKPMEGIYTPARIRDIIGANEMRRKISKEEVSGPSTESNWPMERRLYDEVCTLPPKAQFLERREPAMLELLESAAGTKELCDYIDANWKTNVTLFDMDYEVDGRKEGKKPPEERTEQEKRDVETPTLEINPVDIVEALGMGEKSPQRGAKSQSVLGNMAGFFEKVALSLLCFMNSPGMLTIELVVGEMADVMDRMHHGCFHGRQEKVDDFDPATFPRVYDRIHMSNIP